MKKPVSLLVAGILLLGAIACQKQETKEADSPLETSAAPKSTTQPVKSTATKVEVAETEMAIKLSQNAVPAGPVEFVVKNQGKIAHEFVVLKTDLPLTQLPTKSGGKLDEESKKVKVIAEVGEDDLKKGATKPLRVVLSKGHYVLVCNVGNHFKAGMKADFTVQ